MARDWGLRMRRLVGVCALLGFLAVPRLCTAADAWAVKSAAQSHGELRIVLQDGRVFSLPPDKAQCSFDNVRIAPDGMTVGWVKGSTAHPPEVRDCDERSQYVAVGPVVWRAGRVIRAFNAWGGEINWSFYESGDRIAFHAGPGHFDERKYSELHDVASGALLKQWSLDGKTDPPDWAKGIVDQ